MRHVVRLTMLATIFTTNYRFGAFSIYETLDECIDTLTYHC